jgi:hypothetical protein
MCFPAISAETGIQSFQEFGRFWIPACSGMTSFYMIIEGGKPKPLASTFGLCFWVKP